MGMDERICVMKTGNRWTRGMMALAVSLLAGAALAAYLESDGGRDSSPPPPVRPHPMPPRPPLPEPENAVTRLVRQVEVGRPSRYRQLTVFPLRLNPTTSSDIRTLDEAIGRDWLVIEEKSDAQVGSVRVRNASSQYVLLMSGEMLRGGKQNRMVRDDVLMPPHSEFMEVPVYCGERERWSTPPSVRFESAKSLAGASLRANAAAGASQDAIWGEIAEQSARMKVASPTRDYQQVYDEPGVRRSLDEYFDHLRDVPSSSTVGAVVLLGDDVLGADLFSDPELFSRLWRKIVDSYAVDAIARGDRGEWRGRDAEVRAFLDRALSARFHEQYTPGAGTGLSVAGSARGAALVWQGTAVHVALFGREYVSPVPIRDWPRM